MVVSDPDIHRAARLHLDRHGDEAVAKARDMVRNLKEDVREAKDFGEFVGQITADDD